MSAEEEKHSHPFVLVKLDEAIGVPQSFVDGNDPWTDDLLPGRSNDPTILEKVQRLMRAHANGAALEERQNMLADLFSSQYGAKTLVYFTKYFLPHEFAEAEPAITLKAQAIRMLVEYNVPFVPYDIFKQFIAEMRELCEADNEDELPPLDWKSAYFAHLVKHPFNANSALAKNSPASRAALKRKSSDWQEAMEMASQPGSSQSEQHILDEDDDVFSDDGRNSALSNGVANPAEHAARVKALLATRAKKADMLNKQRLRDGARHEATKKRSREFLPDASDEDFEVPGMPPSGLLALDKFMNIMRTNIDLSRYIDFASMSKERLDALQVMGVSAASSKRLSSSTMLVTSATEADIKTLTMDFDAISSGFLYCYINLLAESDFTDATARVKDRLAWWQWLTRFFSTNKAAAVSFITPL